MSCIVHECIYVFVGNRVRNLPPTSESSSVNSIFSFASPSLADSSVGPDAIPFTDSDCSSDVDCFLYSCISALSSSMRVLNNRKKPTFDDPYEVCRSLLQIVFKLIQICTKATHIPAGHNNSHHTRGTYRCLHTIQ